MTIEVEMYCHCTDEHGNELNKCTDRNSCRLLRECGPNNGHQYRTIIMYEEDEE